MVEQLISMTKNEAENIGEAGRDKIKKPGSIMNNFCLRKLL